MRKIVILPVLALTASLGLVGCSSSPSEEPTDTPDVQVEEQETSVDRRIVLADENIETIEDMSEFFPEVSWKVLADEDWEFHANNQDSIVRYNLIKPFSEGDSELLSAFWDENFTEEETAEDIEPAPGQVRKAASKGEIMVGVNADPSGEGFTSVVVVLGLNS